jgi:dTDP-4-amino-4,6-dideoxygalactose transaminase
MRIGRTVPPAAAPLGFRDLCHGIAGGVSPARALRGFESELKVHFGVRHVFLLSSGTAALTVALQALARLSPRRSVVLPAYTCYSVPAAVMKAGLRPVLCDVDPDTLDYDAPQLERAVTGDTLCAIGHHLFGIPSNIDRLTAVCRAHGAFVVEDAAQAMGVEWEGRPLGTLGDVGIFSLGRGKTITCGSGGVIVTRSAAVARAVAREYAGIAAASARDLLRDFAEAMLLAIFIRPNLYWIPSALPSLRLGQTVFPKNIRVRRLSGVKAGLLRHWRRNLVEANRVRSATAGYFCGRLPVRPPSGPSHPYLRLPVSAASTGQKERLQAESRARGLGLSPAYPAPLNEVPEMRAVVNGRHFPSARRVADRLVTLPTHHWLSERDKQAIAELCANLARR